MLLLFICQYVAGSFPYYNREISLHIGIECAKIKQESEYNSSRIECGRMWKYSVVWKNAVKARRLFTFSLDAYTQALWSTSYVVVTIVAVLVIRFRERFNLSIWYSVDYWLHIKEHPHPSGVGVLSYWSVSKLIRCAYASREAPVGRSRRRGRRCSRCRKQGWRCEQ